jgi:S-adenosylmethionine hydrolase
MASQRMPLITLTTDFGTRDAYVASMKGVIYGIHPDLRVVDLTHDLEPHSILEGALFLAGAIPFFPEGTIHVAVVDPGVGTGRHPIAISAGGQTIVCPDNGLASLFIQEHPLQEARIISNPRFRRETVSATFHGRDIFAPTAARLATGAALHELGEELDMIVLLDVARPRKESGNVVHGVIMHVDHFGNLITNIHRSLIGGAHPTMVRAGSHRLRGVHQTYGEVLAGTSLALFGSSGCLEIAINGGNAHAALRLNQGDAVTVTLGSPKTGKGA